MTGARASTDRWHHRRQKPAVDAAMLALFAPDEVWS